MKFIRLKPKVVLQWLLYGFNIALPLILISCGLRVAPSDSCPFDRPQVFVVLAIENQTNEPDWQNHLIAIGLRNLIQEELFATGCYVPADIDSEVQLLIDELVRKSWQGQEISSDAVSRGPHGPVYETEVKATVKSFSRASSRIWVGPFSSGKVTVKVVVELLVRGSDGITKKVEGMGEGITQARGVLFQIRENKVFFDESTVGMAAQQAIRSAVEHLLE